MATQLMTIPAEAICLNCINYEGYDDMSSVADMSFINSSNIIQITSVEDQPRSQHEFKIPAQLLGRGSSGTLTKHQAGELLCLALSLSAKVVLFSSNETRGRAVSEDQATTAGVHPPTPIREVEAKDGVAEMHATINCGISVTCTAKVVVRVVLDETDLLNLIQEILATQYFHNRSLPDERHAVLHAYQSALCVAKPDAIFKNMFTALEKAIHIGAGRTLREADLDRAVAACSGFSQAEIARIRTCNNRFKHAARSVDDGIMLASCHESVVTDLRKLSAATSSCIRSVL